MLNEAILSFWMRVPAVTTTSDKWFDRDEGHHRLSDVMGSRPPCVDIGREDLEGIAERHVHEDRFSNRKRNNVTDHAVLP